MTQDKSSASRPRRLLGRISTALLPAGVGLFCSWAVLQSFGNYSGWLLAPWLIVAIVVGGMLWPVAVSLTGVPERLGPPERRVSGEVTARLERSSQRLSMRARASPGARPLYCCSGPNQAGSSGVERQICADRDPRRSHAQRDHSRVRAAHSEPDFERLFEYIPSGGRHFLAYAGEALVSHAVVTTRWLWIAGNRRLMTAYVDAVATLPAFQGQGYGTAVMGLLATGIDDFTSAASKPIARRSTNGWDGSCGEVRSPAPSVPGDSNTRAARGHDPSAGKNAGPGPRRRPDDRIRRAHVVAETELRQPIGRMPQRISSTRLDWKISNGVVR